MTAFALDWINLAIRWFHVIVGIAWIGASFHFIWLDFSLRAREGQAPGVFGTSWLVHGGGFYHVEKYLVAPEKLPDDLHWFKWEAYLTFLTGFALLVVQYYLNASAFLVDPAVMPMTGGEAIIFSVLFLLGGWIAYDLLCRSPIGNHTGWLALSVYLLIVGAAFIFTHVFSGRGALIHTGAMVGTMMAANVFRVIIPNQRLVTRDLLAGRDPDAELLRIGKQRSLHNNYLTLPVLLFMVSNHYGFLYNHPQAWAVIALIVLAGGLIRHFINRVDAGQTPASVFWTLPLAVCGLIATIMITAPQSGSSGHQDVSDAEMMAIVSTHCSNCHAPKPRHEAFKDSGPPKGVLLDTVAHVRQNRQGVMTQAVQGRVMPLGNESKMTDDERATLGAWLAAR
jgi:uncharacterized membrane protein